MDDQDELSRNIAEAVKKAEEKARMEFKRRKEWAEIKRKNARRPMDDTSQTTLRRWIREYPSVEDVARRLRLPASAVLSGAAGARMIQSTRRRVSRAMDDHGNELDKQAEAAE